MTADVTIGFPVYNGAPSIADAIRSIQDGSYRNLRILVSDNASTDDTADIVAAMAAGDDRITLHRQSENLGPVGNFRFLAEKAETPFFLWRAYDDLSDPGYIATLRQRLMDVPDAVLAAPKVVTVKRKGDKPRPFTPAISPEHPCCDWRALGQVQAGWMYGMFRTEFVQDAVRYTHENYPHLWGWDHMILFHAMLTGRVTGTNDAEFRHFADGTSSGRYDYDAKYLRQVARDFGRVASQLADRQNIGGIAQIRLHLHLTRFVLKRVARWQRLL